MVGMKVCSPYSLTRFSSIKKNSILSPFVCSPYSLTRFSSRGNPNGTNNVVCSPYSLTRFSSSVSASSGALKSAPLIHLQGSQARLTVHAESGCLLPLFTYKVLKRAPEIAEKLGVCSPYSLTRFSSRSWASSIFISVCSPYSLTRFSSGGYSYTKAAGSAPLIHLQGSQA